MIIFQKFIYREDLKTNQGVMYLFGDNDMRVGKGGQAKEMRGEPNAIGIRVKKAPKTTNAYYTDEEYQSNIEKINEDLKSVEERLKSGGNVVVPTDGMGTGLARLEEFAPKTLRYLQNRLLEFMEKY